MASILIACLKHNKIRLDLSEEPGLRCKLRKTPPRNTRLEDLAVKFSDLELGKILGSGYFGTVYAGIITIYISLIQYFTIHLESFKLR